MMIPESMLYWNGCCRFQSRKCRRFNSVQRMTGIENLKIYRYQRFNGYTIDRFGFSPPKNGVIGIWPEVNGASYRTLSPRFLTNSSRCSWHFHHLHSPQIAQRTTWPEYSELSHAPVSAEFGLWLTCFSWSVSVGCVIFNKYAPPRLTFCFAILEEDLFERNWMDDEKVKEYPKPCFVTILKEMTDSGEANGSTNLKGCRGHGFPRTW
jgi:hypothetical protein